MLQRVSDFEVQGARLASPDNPLAVKAGQLFRTHCLLIAALISVHLLCTYVYAEHGRLQTLWTIFWISGEANVPAFFSAVALLVAAAVAIGPVAISDVRENRPAWRLIGGILLFVSLDEASSIHEKARFFADKDFFPLVWMSAYAVILLGVGLFVFRFWLRLPPATRTWLAVSALVFLSGAVGVELQERSHLVEGLDDWRNLPILISMTVEETLEMLGVAIALRALLRHVALVRDRPFSISVRA